jgi:hypothetical protein
MVQVMHFERPFRHSFHDINNVFLNQFENNLKAKEGQTITDEEDIKNLISESLRFFDDVVVREEIYRLYLKRMKIIDEIHKL